VTVHNQLASLLDGAGEAGAQNKCIQAGLEQSQQVVTGLAAKTLGFLESVQHLNFADAVLSAQTLLFAQTNSVVAVLLLAGAAMLAWTVWAALHVLFSFWSQGKAEGTRKAYGTAGTGVSH